MHRKAVSNCCFKEIVVFREQHVKLQCVSAFRMLKIKQTANNMKILFT